MAPADRTGPAEPAYTPARRAALLRGETILIFFARRRFDGPISAPVRLSLSTALPFLPALLRSDYHPGQLYAIGVAFRILILFAFNLLWRDRGKEIFVYFLCTFCKFSR